jgi:hypothetical protein
MFKPRFVALAFACATSVFPLATSAQSTGLDDLVGARAGQAESALQQRGYRSVRGEKGDDRSYTYWWNDERRQCVSIATMNGRYNSIAPTTAPDCRMSGNDNQRSNPMSGREAHDRYRLDRYSNDARSSRHHMPVRGIGDSSELQAICRTEASARYDRRPSDLTVNIPIRQREGAIVQGWFDADKRTTFFNCRFDGDGRFIGVS